MDWREYQQETARVFRSLGCDAVVEKKVEGVRGEHDVDVFVTFKKLGITTTWIVECKFWNSAIPKEKILALQSIVKDVGADRGIFVSNSGYQSGAIKQATKSNITLTSLEDFLEGAQEEFNDLIVDTIESKLLRVYRTYLYLNDPTEDHKFGFQHYNFDGMEGQKVCVVFTYLSKAVRSFQNIKMGLDKLTIFEYDNFDTLNMNTPIKERQAHDLGDFLNYLEELVTSAEKWLAYKQVEPRT
ncbi:restriction endonuclease [Vibrio sp. TRT 21S02]|uniref:restriction endonuclease n=1 Tax=Vibrio sp. TRT 21S02 TaxID=3418507 RepID=UPI003CEFC96C